MRPVGLMAPAKTSGSPGGYYRTKWPFSRHKFSKWRLILASDHPHLPLPPPLSLSSTIHESVCQTGQDKDQKVRFK